MNRPNWPDRRLCDLLDIESPIVQAPMAGFSTPEMALAARDAGALGSLACAPLDPNALARLFDELELRAKPPLNANFFAHPPAAAIDSSQSPWMRRLAPIYERLGVEPPEKLELNALQPFDAARCELVIEHGIGVVSFHFGLPGEALMTALKDAGVVTMSSATTVRESRWLEDRGCDVVIAQGTEAGGHRGSFLEPDVTTQLGTLALVPQVADAVDAPVVAAGGIADGRGIAAAFALGASGVQIGTAFLFTSEARVSPLHRQALDRAGDAGTSISNVFSGHPARCVTNAAQRELGPIAPDVAPFPLGMAALSPLRAEAERNGRDDFSPHYCGQTAPLCPADRPGTAELIDGLVAGTRHRLSLMGGA